MTNPAVTFRNFVNGPKKGGGRGYILRQGVLVQPNDDNFGFTEYEFDSFGG
jgi:hypothetical protein